MVTPTRRTALHSVGGVLLGLGSYLRVPDVPGFFGGSLEATALERLLDDDEQRTELPPDEFVTSPDDSRLADLAPLEAALRRPGEPVTLSRREFGKAYTALEELPVFVPDYDEGHGHPAIRRGIYVRDDGYTYRLSLVPYCSDRWWVETKGSPTDGNTCRRR